MSALLKLAERCEQAEGPDREIDVLIGEAIDLVVDDDVSLRTSLRLVGSLAAMVTKAECHQNIWRTELPRYSASLDAAMARSAKAGGWPMWQDACTKASITFTAMLNAELDPKEGE